MRPHAIALVLDDHVPIFDLAVACEVFGVDRSELASPWYELRLCAVEPGLLRSTMGIHVQARYGPAGIEDADTVLVAPAGRQAWANPPVALLDAVRAAHGRGARVAAIGTGANLSAAAGVLDGRRATTHWMTADDFAARWPAVQVDPDVLYIDDGDIVTSAGGVAALDVCLHLVTLDHGAAVANAIARRMVAPPQRDGDQAQQVPGTGAGTFGNELGPVLDWALHHLERPITIANLAGRARMSTRTFARRFRQHMGITPAQWLITQRIRRAQEMLETTDVPIDRVARQTGFGSATNLRQHFSRLLKVSPNDYRTVFRRHRTRGLPMPECGKHGGV